MSTAKFRRCHDVTKTWEGGWSDHPVDPGGKTMYGVTEAVYHAWLRQHGNPLRPVRQITAAEAEQIAVLQFDAVQMQLRLRLRRRAALGLKLNARRFGVQHEHGRAIVG